MRALLHGPFFMGLSSWASFRSRVRRIGKATRSVVSTTPSNHALKPRPQTTPSNYALEPRDERSERRVGLAAGCGEAAASCESLCAVHSTRGSSAIRKVVNRRVSEGRSGLGVVSVVGAGGPIATGALGAGFPTRTPEGPVLVPHCIDPAFVGGGPFECRRTAGDALAASSRSGRSRAGRQSPRA